MTEASMIDKGVRKELLWMRFESGKVDGPTVYLSLKFCRFLEGIDYSKNSPFVCIDVILSIECIFADVSPLWRCFDPSLNLICYWNIGRNFHCPKEVMIRNIEFISLMSMNDKKKFESSVHEKQHFSSSVFLIEIENIFEMLIEGSDSVFVLKESEHSGSRLFLNSESEEEKEMIVSEMEEIGDILKLTGGSRSADGLSFSGRQFIDFHEINESVEIIRMEDFHGCKSLRRVIFSSGNHLREIDGFRNCTLLCRIEILPSVETIGVSVFNGCTSLNEIVFAFGSQLREIRGFQQCISLCQIAIPSSVEKVTPNGFDRCASLNGIYFRFDSRLREINGFRQCRSLYRIEIPSSVEKIGWNAFWGCTSLRTVVIRSGCRMKVNEGLRGIKPFLVHAEEDMKEGRRLIHLRFGGR
jgi:hypothetical protein